MFLSLRPFLLLALVPLLVSGCASYGRFVNQPINDVEPVARYSISRAVHSSRSSEITLILAFSGGGTRAAALAYGVLTALRDTQVNLNGQRQRLLDEVDTISAVSGGSFTAAYLGLYGDQIFTDFESDFLRRDVSSELMDGLMNPGLWVSKHGRTEMAVNYYDDKLFNGARFSDLQRRGGPLIIINATDLGGGVRFSFLQEYFDLLCSDLSSFPIASAVAASSAVPILFHPLVLKNYGGCQVGGHSMVEPSQQLTSNSPQLSQVVDGLSSYAQKDQRRYIHLVDGGITDNLGLLAIYEMIEVAGGAKSLLDTLGGVPGRRFIVISVNASTRPQYTMELTNQVPSVENTVNLVTDAQLHRTNASTLELLHKSVSRWSSELTTLDTKVEPYFVEIDFKNIPQSKRRAFFNQIPTSYSLNKAQADDLIAAGRELLFSNGEFQRLLTDLADIDQQTEATAISVSVNAPATD